ncbi:MAG: OmpH family outer membrane protein [Roseovarius sp.]|nr:OmpH family outer membrane protein [Roseovarius sp.]
MRLATFGWLILGAVLFCSAPFAAQAQDVGVVQSDILVLDPDRLFMETLFGQRLNSDYLKQREQLSALNDQRSADLEAEEQALTDLRAQKTPEEFRDLADAFDTKVQQIRRDSDRAVRDLELSRERAPGIFMRAVQPVLVELMQDAGGAVVMDVRTVLLRSDVIDITDVAIARIDQRIGSGPAGTSSGGDQQ